MALLVTANQWTGFYMITAFVMTLLTFCDYRERTNPIFKSFKVSSFKILSNFNPPRPVHFRKFY